MSQPFLIERSEHGDVTVLALKGFLDAHTAPDLEQAIEQAIAAGRSRLLADAQDLTYISSAGLGVFMGFIEDLRDRGGDLKICGLVPKVREVFELLGFHTLFDIVDDRASGLDRFTATPAT